MLFFLTELTLNGVWWTASKTYNVAYWMMYGTQKSKEEIIIEAQKEKLDHIETELQELKDILISNRKPQRSQSF